MRPTKKIFALLASFAVLACSGESAAPVAAKTVQANAPKTPAATQVSAQAPKIELSPEELQLKQGKKVFRKCKSCHTLDNGGRHRIGPNLYGVMGAKIASKDGFAYSKASRRATLYGRMKILMPS